MVRPFKRCRVLRDRPPGRWRRRPAELLGAVTAVGLCALAACALFVPGLVFGTGQAGADSSKQSGAPTEATTSAIAATPAVTGAPTGVISPATTDAPAASSASGATAAEPAVSSGTLLVSLPWGSGYGQVGLAAPGEGLTRGPEALAVTSDGRVAVLDSVNKRVVMLDAGGVFVGSAPLPLAEPRFLAVSDDRLCVLDCDADHRLVSLDWSGTYLGATELPELGEVVTGLFVTDSGPCVELAHENVFLIGTPPTLRPLPGRPLGFALGRTAKVTFKPGNGPKVKLSTVEKRNLKAVQAADGELVLPPGRAVEHLVSVDGDGSGGLVVGARLLDAGPETSGQPSLWIGRFAPGAAARATGAILLADSSFAYLGQPYVVAPDGRVYQPVADEGGYSIFIHSFVSPGGADAQEVTQ